MLLLPPHYRLDFRPCIPAALCALQNFIQENYVDEGAIPTDPYQSAYAPFPSDSDDGHNAGFITEGDGEDNSEVKKRRMNIANEMWESYLNYIADKEMTSSDDDE
jgi:hypothetical protein